MDNTTAYFDIETNAITDWSTLSDLETVHCMVVINSEGVHRFRNDSMEAGLKLLASHNHIVGHNAIGFDYPALNKLYRFRHSSVLDTVVMARCIYPDLRNDDFKRQGFPTKLIGSHSLKAWGMRIGEHKDEHGETEDWSAWSKEMEDYCVQDVQVTKNLFEYLMLRKPSRAMLDLEMRFATIMRRQEINGFPFDVAVAEKLTSNLMAQRAVLSKELGEEFSPVIEKMKSRVWVAPDGTKARTKKELVEKGYKANDITKGEHRTKVIPFNPNSRDQICERLMEQGWKPTAYEGKRPAINEGVLKDIGTPAALKLCDYLLITKRLGQVAEGNQAWLKLHRNGVIHGSVNTNGALSGRCTHQNPNVAQVPAVRAPYGEQCRSCFTAPAGKVLVGVDASGLELRCLAHYLYTWDKGAYAKEILEGDIHTANQNAAGLETRDQAKTFIYAFLYGAGDAKIGTIVGGTSADGKRLKKSFMSKTPAIKRLVDAVANSLERRPFLLGLDGRELPCRSQHSALNLLLQSAGAVIMKQALVEFVRMATKPYKLHANVHDEVQFSCDKEHADELGRCFVEAIAKAGKVLNFRCPLDGEYNIGSNWAETH
jgi:DNA polymerase I-like protein with 3'-5' exonuclease and polymerase domains